MAELKTIADLKPDQYNANKGTAAGRQIVRTSLKTYGAGRSVLVDREGNIIAGNKTTEAATEAGLPIRVIKTDGTELVVVQRTDLDANSKEARELGVMDNRASEKGLEWDAEMLAKLQTDFHTDLSGMFTQDELDAMFETDSEPLKAFEDDYEAPSEIQTDIMIGDLFEIGEHRLLCGDSTDSDAVAKLMNGENAVLMVTDPPYGVNYEPSFRKTARSLGKVLNDDIFSWKGAYELFTGDIAYVWHSAKYTHIFLSDLIECGFEMVSQIIWNKNAGALSRGDIHWKHEPCWYVVRKGKNHNWQGARNVWSVWDIQNMSAKSMREKEGNTQHGTQKPLECMSRPISYNTVAGDGVYDPFLGSGSTMVAAHQLKRRCFGMELEPKYCQVIIDRMQKLDSALVIKKNGHLMQ